MTVALPLTHSLVTVGNGGAPLTHSLVTVHDGVQPVGNGEDCALGELAPDGRLNEAIGPQVHRSCGLIQNQDLGFPKHSPAQA